MELDLGPEIDQFRSETRDWIAGRRRQAWPVSPTGTTRHHRRHGSERRAAAMQHPAYAEWEAELLEGG